MIIFRGTIILPDDVLMIEPLGQNLTDHVIYRLKDQKEKSPKTCGNSNGEHDVQDLMNKFNTYSGEFLAFFSVFIWFFRK